MKYEIPKRLTDELKERVASLKRKEKDAFDVLMEFGKSNQTEAAAMQVNDARDEVGAANARIERFRDIVDAVEIVFAGKAIETLTRHPCGQCALWSPSNGGEATGYGVCDHGRVHAAHIEPNCYDFSVRKENKGTKE